MTLVAALALEGIPTLVGDFLLTVDGVARAQSMYLPTSPHLHRNHPAGMRRPVSLRRKIELINARLAVGFTGEFGAGVTLFKSLRLAFGNRLPSIVELEGFFATSTLRRGACAEVVGWVCANRPICFRWSAAQPLRLLRVDQAISGSGAEHFREEIVPSGVSGHFTDSAVEKATSRLLALIGKALYSEIGGGGTISNAYGFGLEGLLWNGASFISPPPAVFTFWNVLIDPDRQRVQALYSGLVALSRPTGDVMVWQHHHTSPVPNHLGVESADTHISVITSLSGKGGGVDPRSLGCSPIRADYWFSAFRVTNAATGKTAKAFLVTGGGEDGSGDFVSYRDRLLSFNSGELIEMLPPEFFKK